VATQISDEQLTAIVVNAIMNSLLLSGRPVPDVVTATTKLLKEIEGFDSPMGVDVTVDLELQLGINLPHNVFVKEVNGRPRARTLSEVVTIIRRRLADKEA
jgi:acyl carrier protein